LLTHGFFLPVLVQRQHRLGVFMYGVLSEDVALVMVDIHCQAVSLGLASQSPTKTMVLVQWVSAGVLLADEAFRLVFLQDAFHSITPH
jgi:hypothetical protein